MSDETISTRSDAMVIQPQALSTFSRVTMRATPTPRNLFSQTVAKLVDNPPIDLLLREVTNHETLVDLAQALESERLLAGEDDKTLLLRKKLISTPATVNLIVDGVLIKQDITPIKLIEKCAGSLEALSIEEIDNAIAISEKEIQFSAVKDFPLQKEMSTDNQAILKTKALRKAFPEERLFGAEIDDGDTPNSTKDVYRLFTVIQDTFRKEVLAKVELYIKNKTKSENNTAFPTETIPTDTELPTTPVSKQDTTKAMKEVDPSPTVTTGDSPVGVGATFDGEREISAGAGGIKEATPLTSTTLADEASPTKQVAPETQVEKTVESKAEEDQLSGTKILDASTFSLEETPKQRAEKVAKAFKVITEIRDRTQKRFTNILERLIDGDPKKLLLIRFEKIQTTIEELELVKGIQLHYGAISAALNKSAQGITIILSTFSVNSPQVLASLSWRLVASDSQPPRERSPEVAQMGFIKKIILMTLISILTPTVTSSEDIDNNLNTSKNPLYNDQSKSSFSSNLAESFIVSPTQKGGLIWNTLQGIVETELVPGSILASSEEARDAFIGTVLASIGHDPSYFGISSGNIDKIQSGEILDASKISDLVSRLIRMAELTATVSMSSEKKGSVVVETTDPEMISTTDTPPEPLVEMNAVSFQNESLVREAFLNEHFIEMVRILRKMEKTSQLLPVETFCIQNASRNVGEIKKLLSNELPETRDELLAILTYAESIFFRNLRKEGEKTSSGFDAKPLVEVILAMENGAIKTFVTKVVT